MDLPKDAPELPCPKCRYNVIAQVLAGLRVCPECGDELPPVRAEPRTSLRERWVVATGLSEPPFFRSPGAVLALLNALAPSSLLLFDCLGALSPSEPVDAVALCLIVFSALAGAVIFMVGPVYALSRRRWRWLILGLLNGAWAASFTALFVYVLSHLD